MSTPLDPSDPATVFAALAQLIYDGTTFEDVYQQLVDTAPKLVHGCDHASLMVTGKHGFVTVAASDDVARHVDELERQEGEGACVDAITDEAGQVDADITRSTPWPRLAARVVAETPVRGMAGFRILVDRKKVGALNLFSDTPGAFSRGGADEGAVLAAFASVALQSMASKERADSLLLGLESNREIGKAVGLLMAAHETDSETAFQHLRKASNDLNLKLADVAREVVDHAERREPRSGAQGA